MVYIRTDRALQITLVFLPSQTTFIRSNSLSFKVTFFYTPLLKMMRYALAAALSLASFGIAWDENFPLYCGEEHDQFCIQPLSNACYACIHPIETSCPGAEDGNGFKECFCPVPSKTMDAITACINDPSTLCDVERGVLDALNVECQAFNNNMCAVYDPKTKKVSLQSCDGEPV